jgi:hypothetical protein
MEEFLRTETRKGDIVTYPYPEDPSLPSSARKGISNPRRETARRDDDDTGKVELVTEIMCCMGVIS